MARTKTETDLRETPGGVFIVSVKLHEQVDILETKDDSVRVRLPKVFGAPVGFLPKADVEDADAPVPPIDMKEFARECAHQENAFGVSGHYLAAIAQLRSGIVDGKAADGFGLYRLLMTEWTADWNSKQFDFTFVETDINHWRNQCTLFALMARRALDSYVTAFSTRPTAIDLYLTQLVGIEALRLLKGNPTMTVKTALVNAGAARMPPGPPDPDQLIERHAKILKIGGAPATLQQASAQAEIALNAALVLTRALFAMVKVMELAKASDETAPGVKVNSSAVPAGRQAIADQIVKAFADAGFGVVQQVAALANAIAESKLDPLAESPAPEKSYGLFQVNTAPVALGAGLTKEQLFDPAFNIAVIIKEAKRSTLKTAKSVDEAVKIFVEQVERPLNPEADIAKRREIAAQLTA
jgi:hypothetical protein